MKKNSIPKERQPILLAEKILAHFHQLASRLPLLPTGVHWLNPLEKNLETAHVFSEFLKKYYADTKQRTLVLGINPGRFGAGITNIAFTDPLLLEEACGIPNSFHKRKELSAIFVYQVIQAYGGVSTFYDDFFVNSVVPFGFVKNGKNYNYYDSKVLQNAMEPFIRDHLEGLLKLGMSDKKCYCLGEGKNYKYLSGLNEREGYFKQVAPLSHPRFIMQYRRKKIGEYEKRYLTALRNTD